MINVTEFALQLSNQHLWLRDLDTDWHRPLQCNMKVFHSRNSKFSAAYNEKQLSRQARFTGSSSSRQRATSRPGESQEAAEEQPPWRYRQVYTENQGRDWQDWTTREPPRTQWPAKPREGPVPDASGWIDWGRERTEGGERRGGGS